MDIKNLRQIIAIARLGSFAKAADELGIAQPSLSVSVARLEDELKVKLFNRTPLGSEITPMGELIVARAERVIAELRGLERDTQLAAGGEAGQVRFGVGTTLRDTFLSELVLRILQRHPLLSLHYEVAEGGDLLPRLDSRDLDFVVCGDRPGTRRPHLVAAPAFTNRFVVAAPPDHPLTRERGITAERLAEFRGAGAAAPSYRNESMLHLDDGDAVSAVTTNDQGAISALLEAGLVVTGSELFIQPHIDAGRAVALDMARQTEISFVVVATKAASHAPILKTIMGYAQEVGRGIEAELARRRSGR